MTLNSLAAPRLWRLSMGRWAGALCLSVPAWALAQSPVALAPPVVIEPPAVPTAWPGYAAQLVPGPSESAVEAALPADVVVTPPAAHLPEDRVRWSGLWRGWACIARACDVRIAVESVQAEGATVVYAAASGSQAPLAHRAPAIFVGDELHARLHTGARLVLRLRKTPDVASDLGMVGAEPVPRALAGAAGGAAAAGLAGAVQRPAPLLEMSVWRPENRLLSAGVLSQSTDMPRYTRTMERWPTPWKDADGRAQTLQAVVYRPAGWSPAQGPLPTLVFNHGSTGHGRDSAAFAVVWTSPEVAEFFTQRGWQVVFAQRRGRGTSDGVYDEGFGRDRAAGYSCDRRVALAGLDRALEDLDVVMAQVLQRPDVDRSRLLLGGVSRGGLLSVAYAGQRPQVFLGVLNFVGGWLGDGCKEAVAINRAGFAHGLPLPRPSLWLYGDHDPYYTLAHSQAQFDAFRAAGGQAKMHPYAVPAGGDGHSIHLQPAWWQRDMDAYLQQVAPTVRPVSGAAVAPQAGASSARE